MAIEQHTTPEGLSYRHYGEGKAKVVFVHGILGAGRNWQSYVRFAVKNHSLPAVALDQRGHGASAHFQQTATLKRLVEDLRTFIQQHTAASVYLIGHSLGGKVVIELAAENPELVYKLMVVDSSPSAIEARSLEPIQWLKSISPPIASKEEARQALEQFSSDKRLIDFLLTNLEPSDDEGWQWRLDLKGVQELAHDLAQQDLWQQWQQISVPTWLIRGVQSTHLSEKECQNMADCFTAPLEVKEIPQAGHWCHADNPKAFREVLRTFLSS